MLLEELINTRTKEYNLKNPIGKIKEPKNVLGKGTASVVFNDKNDPHMVNKKSHEVNFNKGSEGFSMGRYDGFRDYAKFIIDNKLADKNPWFPRIYEMKNFSHTDSGQNVQKYKIEKLIGLQNLTQQEIDFLYKKLFSIETDDDHDYSNKMEDLEILVNYISIGFTRGESYLEYARDITIEDNTLSQAIDYVMKFKNQYKISLDDWTLDNLMFRRTSYGPQIVIVDPVY